MSCIIISGSIISGKTTLAQTLCRATEKDWVIFCGTETTEKNWQTLGFQTRLVMPATDVSQTLSTIQIQKNMGFVFDMLLTKTATFTDLFRVYKELGLTLIVIDEGGPLTDMIVNASDTWHLLRLSSCKAKKRYETLRRLKSIPDDRLQEIFSKNRAYHSAHNSGKTTKEESFVIQCC